MVLSTSFSFKYNTSLKGTSFTQVQFVRIDKNTNVKLR